MSIMGTRVLRTEDPRLLTEGGVYVDDLRVPELAGAVFATFVRSPVAHALITGIDTSAARELTGVVAVLTAADADGLPPASRHPMAEPLLAAGRVRYVGEPVALVLTEDRYAGEDAAELVSVDYDPLPPVVDVRAALAEDVLLFPPAGTNVRKTETTGNCDDASLSGCDVVISREIVNQRVAAVPLEVRSAAARWADGRLTVWSSTQNAQIARDAIAKRLGLEATAVRVIAPDVGGGFGAKIGIDRDSICVALAARRAGRPVRWAETRSENLVGMVQGRAQRQTYTIGGGRDGRIRAYRLDIVADSGAYPLSAAGQASLTELMAGGVYDISHVGGTYRAVVTNTTPIAAYRGAGRPEATAAIERAVDDFAAEIGMDPAEVRRRNVVPPEKFPYTTPTGATYDTGAYAAGLGKVLAAAGYAGLRAEQARRREHGDTLQLGVGLSCYVEITAIASDGETARLVMHGDGTATVFTGSSAHGQGHHTAWAMLVQDELAIPMDRVTVIHGDTDAIPDAVGTYGSRSLQLGVHQAAAEVREKARRLAAGMLEASEADLELDPAGVPGRCAVTPRAG
jgi:aerobic carbon-monoxide dehydrogenase large subunit